MFWSGLDYLKLFLPNIDVLPSVVHDAGQPFKRLEVLDLLHDFFVRDLEPGREVFERDYFSELR